MQKITERTYEIFLEMQGNHVIVHDRTIRMGTFQVKQEFRLNISRKGFSLEEMQLK